MWGGGSPITVAGAAPACGPAGVLAGRSAPGFPFHPIAGNLLHPAP